MIHSQVCGERRRGRGGEGRGRGIREGGGEEEKRRRRGEEEEKRRRSGRRTALPVTSTKGATCSVLMSNCLA